jgi:hypothetical protein
VNVAINPFKIIKVSWIKLCSHAESTRGGILHAVLLLERLWHFDGKAWATQAVSCSRRAGGCEGVIPARQAGVQVIARLVVVCEARHTDER